MTDNKDSTLVAHLKRSNDSLTELLSSAMEENRQYRSILIAIAKSAGIIEVPESTIESVDEDDVVKTHYDMQRKYFVIEYFSAKTPPSE